MTEYGGWEAKKHVHSGSQVQITPITMVYGRYNELVNVGYNGSHIMINQWEIFRILKWRYVNVPYKTIFCGDIP